jgi:hypothetical protein
LPVGKTLESFDFLFQSSVALEKIEMLATCEFARRRETILLLGPPGTGKTHLTTAIGVKAVENGHQADANQPSRAIQREVQGPDSYSARLGRLFKSGFEKPVHATNRAFAESGAWCNGLEGRCHKGGPRWSFTLDWTSVLRKRVFASSIEGQTVRDVKVSTESAAIRSAVKGYADRLDRVEPRRHRSAFGCIANCSRPGFRSLSWKRTYARSVVDERNKTDRNGARGIAQMMQLGRYRAVHVKNIDMQKVRSLLANGKLLKRKLIDIENHIVAGCERLACW